MPSLRAQQAQLIRNEAFLDQVAGALLHAATDVLNEAADFPNHAHRIAYANAIFTNPVQRAQFFAPGILTNATIAAEAGTPDSILDGDIDFVVVSLFDKYADQFALLFGAPVQLA
jgi:hypothetical protein